MFTSGGFSASPLSIDDCGAVSTLTPMDTWIVGTVGLATTLMLGPTVTRTSGMNGKVERLGGVGDWTGVPMNWGPLMIGKGGTVGISAWVGTVEGVTLGRGVSVVATSTRIDCSV